MPLPSVQDKGELSLIGLTVEELSRNANELRANSEKFTFKQRASREKSCSKRERTVRNFPLELRGNFEEITPRTESEQREIVIEARAKPEEPYKTLHFIIIEAVTKRREMYKIMHIEVETKSRKAP